MFVAYKGDTYKVKKNVTEIPNLDSLDSISARIWINQNTYRRGYSKQDIQLPAIQLETR